MAFDSYTKHINKDPDLPSISVGRFAIANHFPEIKTEDRKRLGIPDRFSAMYVEITGKPEMVDSVYDYAIEHEKHNIFLPRKGGRIVHTNDPKRVLILSQLPNAKKVEPMQLSATEIERERDRVFNHAIKMFPRSRTAAAASNEMQRLVIELVCEALGVKPESPDRDAPAR